jgi:hypothetical protein
MLRNINSMSFPVQETSKSSNNNYERNEKEDMKLAMEYLYEFNEKLNKLHPMCKDLIHHVLQDRRY